MTNKNIKIGYKKSKAYGLCGVILTAALLAIMAPNTYADEVTNTQPKTETVASVTEPVASTQPTTETVAPATEPVTSVQPATETVAPVTEPAVSTQPATETAVPATEPVAPTTETPATEATTNAKETTPTIEKPSTEVSKEGTTITVKNPDVDMHFTKGATGNGTGRYVNFKIEFKNIKFPDSMPIDEGDQAVFHMPKEVTFRTDFDFDVKNSANETIGHAKANIANGTITTTFNDYFSKHQLNKEMSMTFDANWSGLVQSGKEETLNFDGTVKKVLIDPDPEPDQTEKFSKWGSQAPEDPQIMRWTFRLNLAKQTLENLIIKDRWSVDQEFVEGSLEPFFVDDTVTWKNYTIAKDYLDSFHVLNDGFDIKMKTFNRILYVNYRTRLKTPVKESNDPVNAVWVTDGAGNPLANNYLAHVSLAGGKGRASGNEDPNGEKPKKEEPKENPKETPKEEPKENPKENPKEEPKENPKENPKEEPKENPKEEPKENPKEEPKENPKETPKETPKEEPKTHNAVQEVQPQEKQLPNTGTSASDLGFLGLIIGLFAVGLRKKLNNY